jgi:hypothetical protein
MAGPRPEILRNYCTLKTQCALARLSRMNLGDSLTGTLNCALFEAV